MAVKIECQICGFKNDLGRIFCTQCGKRLELTHTSLGELSSRRTFDWGPLIRRLLMALLLLAVGSVIAAALWPKTLPPIPVDPAGVKQIPIKSRAWQSALRARREIMLTYTEPEVNGFLDARARARKLKRLSIDFKPGSLTLAAWHDWTPVRQVTVLTNVTLPVSCELSGRFDGGTLVLQGGRVGHLPLPTPLASLMAPWFKGWFDDILAQTGMVRSLKSVTLDETTARLVFGP
jgi:hypothetical protein